MKKLVYHLLIFWLTYASGAANAHAISDAMQMAAHASSHQTGQFEVTPAQAAGAHAEQDDVSEVAAALAVETGHTDACSQTHCGHGHAAGLLEVRGTFALADTTTSAPTTHRRGTDNIFATMIERPNWRFTTPAVVSLLS